MSRQTPDPDEGPEPGVSMPDRIFHAVRLWLSRVLS